MGALLPSFVYRPPITKLPITMAILSRTDLRVELVFVEDSSCVDNRLCCEVQAHLAGACAVIAVTDIAQQLLLRVQLCNQGQQGHTWHSRSV